MATGRIFDGSSSRLLKRKSPEDGKPPRGSYLSVLLRPKASAVEDDLRNYAGSGFLSPPERRRALGMEMRDWERNVKLSICNVVFTRPSSLPDYEVGPTSLDKCPHTVAESRPAFARPRPGALRPLA